MMDGAKARIGIFTETMKMCENNERLRKSVQESLYNQQIYWENDELDYCVKKKFSGTELVLTAERSCRAAMKYDNKRVGILNFASFVTPGGGVTRGTTAQEESICRISTLYKCIADDSVRIFYDSHRNKIGRKQIDWKNNDDIIYTPDVTVFKEDTFDCEILPDNKWYDVDIITCAAPDLRQYNERIYDGVSLDDRLIELHIKRFKRIFAVALQHGVEVLVLGAFGCGAFYNSPWDVSKAAEHVCEYFDGAFEKIVFAVFTQNTNSDNFKAFATISNIVVDKSKYGIEPQKKRIKIPDDWESIDADSVTHTVKYIKDYCCLTQLDRETRWSFLVKRSEESFGGGCGGICAYKEYKHLLQYVSASTMDLRYRDVASAICFIRMWNEFESNVDSSRELLSKICDFGNRGQTDGEWMWNWDGRYSGLLEKLKCAYYELDAPTQICIVIRVLYAMQWNEARIKCIQPKLDGDVL
jgi:uncharacterized protein (TIGR02452 family)